MHWAATVQRRYRRVAFFFMAKPTQFQLQFLYSQHGEKLRHRAKSQVQTTSDNSVTPERKFVCPRHEYFLKSEHPEAPIDPCSLCGQLAFLRSTQTCKLRRSRPREQLGMLCRILYCGLVGRASSFRVPIVLVSLLGGVIIAAVDFCSVVSSSLPCAPARECYSCSH